MTLNYRGRDGLPIILVAVVDSVLEKEWPFEMFVDTGCHITTFPALEAGRFGHNNLHPKVVIGRSCGLGGKTKCYKHTLSLALLNDKTPFSSSDKMNIAWRSKCQTVDFVTKFQGKYGIIGRDVMREWRTLTFSQLDTDSPLIQITVLSRRFTLSDLG